MCKKKYNKTCWRNLSCYRYIRKPKCIYWVGWFFFSEYVVIKPEYWLWYAHENRYLASNTENLCSIDSKFCLILLIYIIYHKKGKEKNYEHINKNLPWLLHQQFKMKNQCWKISRRCYFHACIITVKSTGSDCQGSNLGSVTY